MFQSQFWGGIFKLKISEIRIMALLLIHTFIIMMMISRKTTLSRADLFRADFFFAFIKFFYLENFRDLIYSLQAFAIFLINLCLSLWVRLWWFTFFFETLVKMLNLFFLRNKWRFLLFLPPDLRHTRASTHIGVHILCKGPHLLKWACRKHFFDFKAIKIVRCSQRFLNKFQR